VGKSQVAQRHVSNQYKRVASPNMAIRFATRVLVFDSSRQSLMVTTVLIIHRRSVAKRGGCFQRRMFVCHCVLCVCPHDNFRTTKRRTIKLGCYVHCTKILPEFEGQGHQGQKRKTAESSQLTMHSRAYAVGRPYAARSNTVSLRATRG